MPLPQIRDIQGMQMWRTGQLRAQKDLLVQRGLQGEVAALVVRC